MTKRMQEAPAAKEAAHAERLIRLREVMRRTGRSRSSLYADIKDGNFPPNLAIGRRAVAWTESSISEWIATHVAASRGGRS
jgi:prophage regulatory protein